MGVIERHSILTGFKVGEAMRRQVLKLPETDSIKNGISLLIKYKTGALLIIDKDEKPCGVVSKTDIMSAYYAGFSLDQKLKDIIGAQPITCSDKDALEDALELMRQNYIHRLYVYKNHNSQIVGLLAYPDIVGLMYRLCIKCKNNYMSRKISTNQEEMLKRFKVKDVMSTHVQSKKTSHTIYQVIEGLSQYRFGAMLIRDNSDTPVGVVSKTDLLFAYKHGISPDVHVKEIMSKTVLACDLNTYLSDAIQKMIFSDIHRLFVYQGEPTNIVGVLSFTDAAKLRSGSCKACITSRIMV